MKSLQKNSRFHSGLLFCRTILCLGALLGMTMSVGAAAPDKDKPVKDSPPWMRTVVGYAAMEQNLKQILDELAFQAGVPIQVSRTVDGKIKKRRIDGKLSSVLDSLSREYNLIWFSDGGSIYIDRADESITQVFKLQGVTKKKVEDALDRFAFINVRDKVMIGDDGSYVRVTGPDSMNKLVETAISTLDGKDLNLEIIRFGKKTEE
jgi:type III secretion protein C